MNDETSGTRGRGRAGALAAVLAAACAGCSTHTSVSVSGGTAAFAQVAALAQCMRSHGVPNFPDPPAIGQASASVNSAGIDHKSPQFLAAVHDCRYVLPTGVHLHLHVSARGHTS